jgi:hypothetical protein
MCEQCTRREFMEAGVLSSLAAMGAMSTLTLASQVAAPPPRQKARICVLFTGAPGPADRGWNTDPSQLEKAKQVLAEVERNLGNVELIQAQVQSPEQTEAALKEAGPGAPVLAINLHCFALTRMIQPVLKGGHPMVVFSLPASGHDWMYPMRWRREGHPVTLLASADYQELERAIRLLRVIPLMRQTRLLLFPPAQGTAPACDPQQVKDKLGTEVLAVEQADFDEMMAQVNEAAVRDESERWTNEALQILEPNAEDIDKAARVSIALQRLMEHHHAQGLAVGTCMGWLARGFPCLGFTRLRDCGLPAACEGDMDSLLTMMLFQYAFDKPGFQGNATFDTSRNAVWTAHCTAPLRLDGADGPDAPYLLRGHSEVGGSGCVPEVHYRLGEIITRTKLINLDTILISTGKIIEVPEKSIRACRTQIVTEVRDAAKMVANWSSILQTNDAMTLLHRVVYYGDHMQSVRHLADLLDMKVAEEV